MKEKEIRKQRGMRRQKIKALADERERGEGQREWPQDSSKGQGQGEGSLRSRGRDKGRRAGSKEGGKGAEAIGDMAKGKGKMGKEANRY